MRGKQPSECEARRLLGDFAPTQEPPSTAQRALSFGSVAEDYDRYRPWPPRTALEWLLPKRVSIALDLGAGTGALSRRLLARADEVIAIEPDARMRAVLARRLPQVRLLAGTAESLPLPDASVDAVLVAAAWHWLDPEVAVPEIARILRRGGALGIVWTDPDRDAAIVDGLWEAAREFMPQRIEASQRHQPEDVELPPSLPFDVPEIHRLRYTWHLSAQRLVGLLGTYSSVIALPDPQRGLLLDRAREYLSGEANLASHTRVALPMSCRCWKARRL